MKKASESLSTAQREQLERAIAAAEQKTSAEIVVVIATRSGRYDRAEDTFGVLLALLAVSLAWVFYQDLRPASGDWAMGTELHLGLIPVLVLFVFWWLVGLGLATRFPVLARPFVSRAHIEAEVRRRGFEAFHLFRVTNTRERTGVLVFVSLLEHVAWVSGDDAVNAAVPEGTWQRATGAIGAASRRGELAKGLEEAVGLVGEAVASKFPRSAGDTDELPNAVHFLD
jgi:putative membrane protein